MLDERIHAPSPATLKIATLDTCWTTEYYGMAIGESSGQDRDALSGNRVSGVSESSERSSPLALLQR
jgi:hypothetical protein